MKKRVITNKATNVTYFESVAIREFCFVDTREKANLHSQM